MYYFETIKVAIMSFDSTGNSSVQCETDNTEFEVFLLIAIA